MTAITPEVVREVSSEEKSQKKRVVATLGFAQLGDFGEGQIANSMFPAIREALGLNLAALGTITAVRRIVAFIMMPIWGAISDRYSRKGVLVWATGVWGIWTLAIGFTQSFNQFLMMVAVAGVGIAAIDGPLSSLISDLFPKEERGRAFGNIKGIAYFAIAPTLIYFKYLTDNFPDTGWRIAFWTFGILSILSGILIAIFIKEPIRGKSEDAFGGLSNEKIAKEAEKNPFSLEKARTLFERPTFIFNLIDKFFIAFPTVILFAFVTTWLVDDRNVPQGQAILFTLAALTGLVLGSFAGGQVGDRLLKSGQPRKHLIYGHVAQVVMAISWVMLFVIDWSGGGPIFVLLMIAGFTQEFRTTGIVKVVVSRVMLPEVRGLGFSLERAVDSLGRVAAALLVGYFADQVGLTQTFIWFGAFITILLIGIYFLYYRSYENDAEVIQATLAARTQA